jgi:hypothetical protein
MSRPSLNVFRLFERLERLELFVLSRRALFGFYQPAVSAVAVRMVFGFPAAADRYRFGSFEIQNKRFDVRNLVGTVAKRQILASRAAAVRDAFRYLLHDRWFNEVIVG